METLTNGSHVGVYWTPNGTELEWNNSAANLWRFIDWLRRKCLLKIKAHTFKALKEEILWIVICLANWCGCFVFPLYLNQKKCSAMYRLFPFLVYNDISNYHINIKLIVTMMICQIMRSILCIWNAVPMWIWLSIFKRKKVLIKRL